jgi:hypothetical protein
MEDATYKGLENFMNTIKYVYWQDEKLWLGYLMEYPDYKTQGRSLKELQENLKDIYLDMTSGAIPHIKRVGDLQLA